MIPEFRRQKHHITEKSNIYIYFYYVKQKKWYKFTEKQKNQYKLLIEFTKGIKNCHKDKVNTI